MTSLLALAQVLLVVAVFWVPGFVMMTAAGARGLVRIVAVSPAVTIAVFFVASVLAARLNLRWNLPLALACSAAVAVAARAVRRRLCRTDRRAPRRPVRDVLSSNAGLVAALAVGVIAQLVPVWRPILQRDEVSNLTDTLFHFNALEYIRLAGVAEPVTLGSLIDPSGRTAFYPSGWHSVAGVVPVALDNTSVLAASTFVVIAISWSCGLAALAGEVATASRRIVVILAVLLGVFGASSPLEPAVSLGIVPDAVGLALVPGTAAWVVRVVRGGHDSTAGWFVVALLTLGLGACHPSALAGAGLVVLPWLAAAAARWWSAAGRFARAGAVLASVLAVGAAGYWVATNPVLAAVRSHRSESAVRFVDAVIGLLIGSTAQAATIGVVVPLLAFLAWALRLRRGQDVRPMISWMLVGVVYVLAAMDVPWGAPVTGFFYMEARRVVPLLSVWAVVLGAEGLARGSVWIVDRTERPAGVPSGAVVGAVSGALVIIASWQPPAALAQTADEAYTDTVSHPLTAEEIVPFFTRDELQMVGRLRAELPAGAVLFGAPRSGVSYVYGLTGLSALPFAFGMAPDLTYAAANIDKIDTDPRVCEAFRSHGVTHVYTDPDQRKARGWEVLPDPMVKLPAADRRLVDQGGSAKVYAVTGCEGISG